MRRSSSSTCATVPISPASTASRSCRRWSRSPRTAPCSSGWPLVGGGDVNAARPAAPADGSIDHRVLARDRDFGGGDHEVVDHLVHLLEVATESLMSAVGAGADQRLAERGVPLEVLGEVAQ